MGAREYTPVLVRNVLVNRRQGIKYRLVRGVSLRLALSERMSQREYTVVDEDCTETRTSADHSRTTCLSVDLSSIKKRSRHFQKPLGATDV